MLVNINYLKAIIMKKNVSFSGILLIAILTITGCGEKSNSSNVEVKIYPGESTIVIFDRLLEFKQDTSLKPTFREFGFYKHLAYPGLIFPQKFTKEISAIIKSEENNLLLGEKESLKWGQKEEGMNSLFLINPSRQVPLKSDLISSIYIADKNQISIKISKKGVGIIQDFLVNNLNKKILIECNGQIVSVLDGIGDYKSGEIIIQNVQLNEF